MPENYRCFKKGRKGKLKVSIQVTGTSNFAAVLKLDGQHFF
jgi:hypothetical protein